MATRSELVTMSAAVNGQIIQNEALIAVERAKVTPRSEAEQRLRAMMIGHLRHVSKRLSARYRYLLGGIAAIDSATPHPATNEVAPVSSGQVSIPKRPSRPNSV